MSPFFACQKKRKSKLFMPTRPKKKFACGKEIETGDPQGAAGQKGTLWPMLRCRNSTFYGPEPWQNATLNLIINYRAIAERMRPRSCGGHTWLQTQVNAPEYTRLCTTPRMSNMRDCLCQRACVGELQVVMQINIRIRLDFPKNVHYKLQIGLCLLNSCYTLAVFM